jgi:hypothetical protein
VTDSGWKNIIHFHLETRAFREHYTTGFHEFMNIHSFILPLCLCLLITFFPTRPIHFLLCWIYGSQAVPRKSKVFYDVMSYSLIEARLRVEILLPSTGSKSCSLLTFLAYFRYWSWTNYVLHKRK